MTPVDKMWMCIVVLYVSDCSPLPAQQLRPNVSVFVSVSTMCSQAIWVQLGPGRQETHSLTDTHPYTHICQVIHTSTMPPFHTHPFTHTHPGQWRVVALDLHLPQFFSDKPKCHHFNVPSSVRTGEKRLLILFSLIRNLAHKTRSH